MINCDTPDTREHSKSVENTRLRLVFSTFRRVLSNIGGGGGGAENLGVGEGGACSVPKISVTRQPKIVWQNIPVIVIFSQIVSQWSRLAKYCFLGLFEQLSICEAFNKTPFTKTLLEEVHKLLSYDYI